MTLRAPIACFLFAAAVVAGGCTSPDGGTAAQAPGPSTSAGATDAIVTAPESGELRNHLGYRFPPAPGVPKGLPSPELVADLDLVFGGLLAGLDGEAIERIGASGDARAAWLLADLLRFIGTPGARDTTLAAFEELTGVRIADDPVSERSVWQSVTDHLVAWDLPSPEGYRTWKKELFVLIDQRWAPFFEDAEADIDWRILSWGGVLMDDRPLGTTTPCPRGCIPALDDPDVTSASEGTWYPDDSIVFGVTVGGESRAYPKHMMEVHEMVNDTLGGRRVGIPYCTLCGSAQAYLTDSVPGGVDVPVLRTSGLLSRSNKVMFDLDTRSVIDTFTGVALSGPLHDQRIELQEISVVTSTWGDWKRAHPGTTILAEDGGIGRFYVEDPLGGRDDNGPIFPIGAVDERLDAQERVLGVIAPGGTAIAFPVDVTRRELADGAAVEVEGVVVIADGSGVRAVSADGIDLAGHEAFWFAWSQFHPDTILWSPQS